MPHRVVRALAPLVPAAALLVAAPAAAQQPARDTLPFRPGQWGLEGTITGSAVGTGVLRFLSRSSALTLNLSGGFSSSTQEQEGGTSPDAEFTRRAQSLSANLGVRRYRALDRGVVGLVAFGGTASVGRSTSRNSPPDPSVLDVRQVSTGWGVGAFGEVGGMILLTPRLGLSGMYGLHVTRTSDRIRLEGAPAPQPVSRSRGWSVGMGGVSLNASLFF